MNFHTIRLNSGIRRAVFFILFAVLASALIGCSDLEEIDVRDESVALIAPFEGALVETDPVNFSWNSLEGAIEYRFEIATPTFDRATELVARQLTSEIEFSQVLEDGSYEWRVTAINEGGESLSSPRALTVTVPDSLTSTRITQQ